MLLMLMLTLLVEVVLRDLLRVGHKRQPMLVPLMGQGLDQVLHHRGRVVRSGCDAEALRAHADGGKVDGLHVNVVLLQKVVRNLK